MPTYVYKFVETGETIEVQQAFTDDSLTETVHPGTGEVMAVKKVFQPVGVTFRGDGFYKTDSRGSGPKSAAAPTAGESSTGTSGDGASGSDGSTSTPAKDTPAKKDTAATPAASTSGSTTSSGD